MVVLIVDGTADTRSARAELLRGQEHQVVEVSTAAEAVQWANTVATLDLLITEVVLDTETFGFDLKDAIKAKFPSLITLYTTHYDLAGYEQDMEGAMAIATTTSDADFLAHVLTALRGSPHEVVLPPLLPPGTQLGYYQILERLYIERESETYLAFQTTVQRKVALVLLKPELNQDAAIVRDFKERERIKARLSHPRIAPLYEGKDEHGYIYYTRELPPGQSLDELLAKGTQFTERVMTDVLFRIADAMTYAASRGLNYRPLGLRDIYVDAENQASIANIFRPPAATPRDPVADVKALLDLMLPFANQGKARGLLHELAHAPHDWGSIAHKLDDIRSDMSERSLLRRAESEDLTEAVPMKKRWLFLAAGILACIVVALLGGLTGKGLQDEKEKPLAVAMIQITPATYTYQTDQQVQLQAPFWISKYEVTIAQYARFLAALKTKTTSAYDDPNQLIKTSHKPENWDASYAAAATGGLFNNQKISLNSPVTQVSYWDAVAYAKWAQQRLPTEEEWEIAARGIKATLYPWGNHPNPIAANLGDDYNARGKGGETDGYNFWAPVDKPVGDTSELGVMGMAGNVQEWTSTWATHPELPDTRVPVLRGGHFAMKSNPDLLTSRHFPESAEEATLARGFRTVDATRK